MCKFIFTLVQVFSHTLRLLYILRNIFSLYHLVIYHVLNICIAFLSFLLIFVLTLHHGLRISIDVYISISIKPNTLSYVSVYFFCFYSARQDCNTFQSMSKSSQPSIDLSTYSHFNYYNLPDYYHKYHTKRYLLS